MIQGFETLSENQFETTKHAIAWITALIAGADGKIDNKETAWAEKLTKIRSYDQPNVLTPFYEEVGKDFTEQLDATIAHLPESQEERNQFLSNKLAQLNDIFTRLDNEVAYTLYQSYRSFAQHVAKASGGFLGMMSIDKDEAALIGLPMIEEIHYIHDEEE